MAKKKDNPAKLANTHIDGPVIDCHDDYDNWHAYLVAQKRQSDLKKSIEGVPPGTVVTVRDGTGSRVLVKGKTEDC